MKKHIRLSVYIIDQFNKNKITYFLNASQFHAFQIRIYLKCNLIKLFHVLIKFYKLGFLLNLLILFD